MKISIGYANDVSTVKVVNAEYSAEEVRDLYAACNGDVRFICHAIYTHARSKVGKKSNFLNKLCVTNSELEWFEASKFCYFQLCEAEIGLPQHETLTYQVMYWLQKENGFHDPDLFVYSELTRIHKFNEGYRKLDADGIAILSFRTARMALLNDMVNKNAGGLKVQFLYI